MADRPNSEVKTNFQPCIIVHGGAWAIPDVLMESSVRGVKKAAEIGYESLITVKVLFFSCHSGLDLWFSPRFNTGTRELIRKTPGMRPNNIRQINISS